MGAIMSSRVPQPQERETRRNVRGGQPLSVPRCTHHGACCQPPARLHWHPAARRTTAACCTHVACDVPIHNAAADLRQPRSPSTVRPASIAPVLEGQTKPPAPSPEPVIGRNKPRPPRRNLPSKPLNHASPSQPGTRAQLATARAGRPQPAALPVLLAACPLAAATAWLPGLRLLVCP